MTRIDFTGNTKLLRHTWSNCVGAGRANEGLRADWQSHLKEVVDDCGFQYLRFHGLLHDDMHVYHMIDGVETYNFQYIDNLFDAMLDIGIKPFVELGFTPRDMASTEATQFWWKGNVAPPKDFSKWGKLVKKLISHWIDRYSMQEVKTWYFEVWNEPNLRAFWDGTKSQYFELYKTTVNAVKSIETSLKVGGPATSNFVPDTRFNGETEDVSAHATLKTKDIDSLLWKGVWIPDFLNYCYDNHLPIDFISCHPYPTDFALDGHGEYEGRTRKSNSTKEDIEWIHNVIKGTAYENAEIHLTEWSSSPSSRDYSHDYLPAATYVMKTNLNVCDLADSLSYWAFTDVFEEMGAGPEAFHGGFGMITMQGVKKPMFYVYQFLNELGDYEIARNDGYMITKTNDNKLVGVFYNYPEKYAGTVAMSMYPDRSIAKGMQNIEDNRIFDITIEKVKPNTCYLLEILDKDHGVAIDLWEKMGCPCSPNHMQTKELIQYAQTHKFIHFTSDESGSLTLYFTLSAWAISSLKEV